jgi:hypothetical protein
LVAFLLLVLADEGKKERTRPVWGVVCSVMWRSSVRPSDDDDDAVVVLWAWRSREASSSTHCGSRQDKGNPHITNTSYPQDHEDKP